MVICNHKPVAHSSPPDVQNADYAPIPWQCQALRCIPPSNCLLFHNMWALMTVHGGFDLTLCTVFATLTCYLDQPE